MIKVKIKTCAGMGIVDIYDTVLETLGAYNPDHCTYDCKHINVSSNIRQIVRDGYGNNETDFAMAWICYGPKEDETLPDDTVAIEDGFITEGTK